MKETQNLEFKESWRKEYLAWICGMANAYGGELYVGINDKLEIKGVNNADELLEVIPNMVKDKLGINVYVDLLHEGDLKYIRVRVLPSYMPISYRNHYYLRSGSTNQELTGENLDAFKARKCGVTWDSSPVPRFTAADIDPAAVKKFKESACHCGRYDESSLEGDDSRILELLHLIRSNMYTNAAVLLFSSHPENWIEGAYINIGFMDEDTNILYNDTIQGPLMDQIDTAVQILYSKYFRKYITYSGIHRIERYPFPIEALREALLNAIVHKNYATGKVPVHITVTENKLIISNTGGLPANWTLDTLTSDHESEPRNPYVAEVLFKAGYVESWGRGVAKMLNSCRNDGIGLPQYSINGNALMIEFIAPADRCGRTLSEAIAEKVSDGEAALLKLLLEDPAYTAKVLADKLGVSRQTISLRIKLLKQNGIIKRIGSAKFGYWEIAQ